MSPDPTADLKELARGVVLAQGNAFIKDLLRRHQITIGATKEDFLANLETAIDDGRLTRTDFERWLEEVEGWGHAHIYALNIPDGAVSETLRTGPEAVRDAVEEMGLLDYWEAGASHAFPDELALARILYRDRTLQVEWHRSLDRRRRAPEKDHEEVIGDERYEFHAYHVTATRRVVRLYADLDRGLVALFVQIPQGDDDHDSAIEEAWETVEPLLGRSELRPFDISYAIRQIDEDQLDVAADDSISTQNVQYADGQSYAEFGTNRGDRGYAEADAIREVRRAVRGLDVSGRTAKITFEAPGEKGMGRAIVVRFHGEDRRLWIRAQVTAEQALFLLDLIQPHSARAA